MLTRIEPTAQRPEPTPFSGGTWRRDPDGGLTPMDEATAAGAGLDWPAPLAVDSPTINAPQE